MKQADDLTAELSRRCFHAAADHFSRMNSLPDTKFWCDARKAIARRKVLESKKHEWSTRDRQVANLRLLAGRELEENGEWERFGPADSERRRIIDGLARRDVEQGVYDVSMETLSDDPVLNTEPQI